MTKLLVVKTSSLGDIVHALPALTDVKQAIPDLVVDWVAEPAFADIVRLHPGVRRVWDAPLRRWRGRPFDRDTWKAAADLRRGLRAEAYDMVLDAQGLFKSALVSLLAGRGRPVGLDRHSSRGGIAALLNGRRLRVPPELHAVDRMRLLFGAALGYRPDLAVADAGLPSPGCAGAGTPRAFLLHGTTWPSKAWPKAQWIALARALVARGYRPAMVFAGPEEEALARAVAAVVPETEVLGRRSLADVAALLGDSALVVGVDTGLTHLAAALGRPTIALFASTPADQTEPRGKRVAVLSASIECAPCRQRRCPLVPRGTDPPCHATIGPDRVLAVVDGWATAEESGCRHTAVP